MEIAEARHLWRIEPGWLNTASYGLPPQPAWEALQAALADWRSGKGSWEGWGRSVATSRALFARLYGLEVADVAVGAQVSQMLAPVAAGLPDGATVLVPDIEFTSNVFPWAVHADRGVTVRTAPVAKLAEHLDSDVDVVAFSLVQSADGEIADLAAISETARACGATVVVDATQACGWLPFTATLADVVVAGAYKWMMAPRGTGFCYLAPALREKLRPLVAGWFASDQGAGAYYGLPMRLASDARAFDLSPAWHPWVGTAPALEVIEQIGVEAIHRHNVALANRFLTGLGQPPSNSAIVTVNVPGAEEKLAAAGIRAAVRKGVVRASFHVYSTESDVDAALNALA
ncbi:aminotransferase class V [Rhizocola hellebori]|uniref:Aminotransferase class V n=1 Tax=Rhizocola hellebori TaxID=1392758 RepID=A0A8J3Q831_9ACTN|nr:aminotransferase class V-fold PLP-dependent enzyme [Rhizocola hellebori]GIH05102.1 aminotransferase class V [Rhizocola hellebori]